MSIVISGTTGIDAGSLPVSNCGNTEVEGNLNLSGVGARITGDFSNATYSNRIAFQTNVPNTYTTVAAIPNGTGANASFQCYSSSDMNNSTRLHMGASTNLVEISSSPVGTASYVPLVFTTGGSERVRIGTTGNIGINKADGSYKFDIKGNLAINAAIFGHYFVNYQDGKDINTDYGAHMLVTGDAGTTQKAYRIGTKFNSGDSDYVFEYSTNTQSYGSDPSLLTFSEKMRLKSNGSLLLTSGTGGLGYGTGAGGTVTQLTSKSTAVTLNKPSGQITMNGAALAAGTRVTFTLNNSLISSSDTLLINFGAGSYTIQSYNVWSYCWNGTATVVLGNISVGSLSEQVVLSYELIKGATA